MTTEQAQVQGDRKPRSAYVFAAGVFAAHPRRLSQAEASTVLRQMVELLTRPLLALVYSITRDYHCAQDIVQEAFLKLHGRLNRQKTDRKVVFWVRKVAANAAIDYVRRRDRTPESVPVEEAEDCAAMPQVSMEDAEVCREIAAALRRMPDRKRVVFELRAMDGMTYEEIGGLIGIRAASARKIFERVRSRLLRTVSRP